MEKLIRRLESFRFLGPLLAAAGAGMIAFGIHRGEMAVVFAKAVRVCMECIGIG